MHLAGPSAPVQYSHASGQFIPQRSSAAASQSAAHVGVASVAFRDDYPIEHFKPTDICQKNDAALRLHGFAGGLHCSQPVSLICDDQDGRIDGLFRSQLRNRRCGMTPAIAFIALAVTGALVIVAVIAAIALIFAGVRAIDAADAETLSEARSDNERNT